MTLYLPPTSLGSENFSYINTEIWLKRIDTQNFNPHLDQAIKHLIKHLKEKDFANALLTIEQGVKRAQTLKNPPTEIDFITLKGYLYQDSRQYKKAAQYFEEGLQKAIETQDHWRIGTLAEIIGKLYASIHNTKLALEYYTKAMKVKGHRNPDDQFGLFTNICFLYIQMGDFKKALFYSDQAMKLRNKIINQANMVALLINRSNIFSQTGFPEKQLAALLKAKKLNEQEKIEKSQVIILGNLSDLYLQKKDYPQAMIHAREGINIGRKMGFTYGLALNLANFGIAASKTGRVDEGIEKLKQSLTLLTEIKSQSMIITIHRVLAETYAEAGEYQEAYRYQKQYKRLSDLQYKNDKQAQIIAMQERFEAVKKEKEIDYLKQEQSNKEYRIRIFQITLALLVILILIIIHAYLNKRKVNRILSEQTHKIQEQASTLRKANDKLIELSYFKENLTGMIVHDLKNMINAVYYYSQEDFDNSREVVNQSAKQMLNVVANILDVQRFEDSEMRLSKEILSLHHLVERAIDQIRFLSIQSQIKINSNIPEGLTVKGDREIIQRVLINLLTNAIKHMPGGGQLTISSSGSKDGKVEISVQDTGMGIPQDKLSFIFDKYQQVHRKGIGLSGSSGLGLTFCRLAVESHGGEIGVESEVNKGSTFWFSLEEGIEVSPTKDEMPAKISLTPQEKSTLKPFIERFNRIEVYEISDLNQVIAEIPAQSNNIKSWLKQIQMAIDSGNEKFYRQLLKQSY